MSLIRYINNVVYKEIELPASKSIYNRLLIIKKLYNLELDIKNPSKSDDSLLLEKLIDKKSKIINCKNAGTVIRFLAAYFAAKNENKILGGSNRMKQRPIGELINALNNLGAKITYIDKRGFPPVCIHKSNLYPKTVIIKGTESSQYISALIMIGAFFKGGLKIILEGTLMSKPYIDMTVNLMKLCRFEINYELNKIEISEYKSSLNQLKKIEIEADWSAAAFWYQIVLLSKNLKIKLNKLHKGSNQGDSKISEFATKFGIKTSYLNNGIMIENTDKEIENNTVWDFADCPDLAPSVIVMLSASCKKAIITGIETLKIKESNRSLALQNELKKCNVKFTEKESIWELDASNFRLIKNTTFKNYNDHRIAMALAPLAIIKEIKIKTGNVCNKSYPDFWHDLKKAGFEIID
ncbi:MAG: 3-phosphoshikimate 1-carboxyvinyltransferase [Bacteroidia bacterium]|nr:3-phosphoshikimate 1-carboxyvinyltransferase [Bacteroidia bacterium]